MPMSFNQSRTYSNGGRDVILVDAILFVHILKLLFYASHDPSPVAIIISLKNLHSQAKSNVSPSTRSHKADREAIARSR